VIFIKEHFFLIMMWVLAVVISITSYIALRNIFPTPSEILLGHTLYAGLAMPNAFLNMVGLLNSNSPQNNIFFYLLAALYWGVIGAAHYWYAEERDFKYVAVIAFFVLASSVKWLYFAVALMYA
jgi:hypothetical protein